MRVSSPVLGGWLKRRVIVTGGASGFGEATVRWMANRGAKVVIADLNEERGKDIANSINQEKLEGSAFFVKADVTQSTSWSSLVKSALDEFGGLDVLINNAGGSYVNKPSLEVTEPDFDKCINLNVRSLFHSVEATMPHFLSQKQGTPWRIDMSNDILFPAFSLNADAAKAAVNAATKSLAVEYATSGVRVNAVCPVAGHTPSLKTFLGKNSEAAFRATVPMGRLTQPEDVASAIGWLASDEAKFITGVCLEVDGGRCV
ncbi:oxidoreductase [Sanghuangporus baumii]|uniref:Oxidoreductase n=1 Tax=Sanghuangporus baumii TaxID=108892 RepID=A0A9Q5HXX3_SANBA|nr:oxidoreductase [Sanghuangporus baumii]